LLRTIHLGHITLSLERKVEEIGRLLDVTSTVTGWIDEVLAGQAGRHLRYRHRRARVRTPRRGSR
jgi:hypothetical protein